MITNNNDNTNNDNIDNIWEYKPSQQIIPIY